MAQETKLQEDISNELLSRAMEQIKDLEAEKESTRPTVESNEVEVQTEIEYPVAFETIVEVEVIKEVEKIVEIIKEVQVIKEVMIKEDADKIDDTELPTDPATGLAILFEQSESSISLEDGPEEN